MKLHLRAMHRFFCVVALWLPLVCSAQLAGHFEYNFNARPLLWDFTGTYVIPQGIIQTQNTLTNWPDGSITGIGHTHYDSFFIVFDADDTQTGRVSGASTKQIRLDAKGLGRFAGRIINPYAGVFKETTKGILDPTNRTVVALEKFNACEAGSGCQFDSTNTTFQLPSNMNGTWSLTLDIATSNKVVKGTASAELSNGRTLSFVVRGTQPSALTSANLKLTGTNDAMRTTLSVRVGTNGQLQSLKGKLFGQTLVFL